MERRSRERMRIGFGFHPAPNPPEAQIIDPYGPGESKWPRGWLNFGNVVFALCLAEILLLVALMAPLF